jgi:hypothetical protein
MDLYELLGSRVEVIFVIGNISVTAKAGKKIKQKQPYQANRISHTELICYYSAIEHDHFLGNKQIIRPIQNRTP